MRATARAAGPETLLFLDQFWSKDPSLQSRSAGHQNSGYVAGLRSPPWTNARTVFRTFSVREVRAYA
jgi:hypothetical protein